MIRHTNMKLKLVVPAYFLAILVGNTGALLAQDNQTLRR